MKKLNNPIVRIVLLLEVVVNLTLIAIRVLLYRPLLGMPGALRFIVEPVISLLAVALFLYWAADEKSGKRQSAISAGVVPGMAGSILLVLHMALEVFGSRVGENGRITLGFMIATFFLWGVAGYRAARDTNSIGLGIVSACWSAMISVLAVLTFGFVLMFFAVPPLDYVASWGEFKQSGWSDVQAFAIANSLEAGFTHILAGGVFGTLTGFLGAIAARLRRSATPPALPLAG